MAPRRQMRKRSYGRSFAKKYGGFKRRFKEKWSKTKAVRRRAIGSRRRYRNPFSFRSTEAIRQIALGNGSPLAFMGIFDRNYMQPAISRGNNPFTPRTFSVGVNNYNCFGTFAPTFVRGTADEVVAMNDPDDDLDYPPKSTLDRSGDQISGDTVYVKGYRILFTGADAGDNKSEPPTIDSNYYRIILAQVNQNQSQNTDTMVDTDWCKIWRSDVTPGLDTTSIDGNGPFLQNTMMAYRDRDEINNYKFIRDTKWTKMLFNNEATSNVYNPVEHDFYIPVNRRFIIADNGDLVGWSKINWAILGTWMNNQLESCPSFRMRIDLYYKN